MTRRWLAVLALPLLLAACGGTPAPKPASLALTIIGSAGQNPDAAGTGEPVAVRIYPLASSGKFATSDPYSLMGSAAALLGTDLAGPSDQVIVAPGATVAFDQVLPPTAQTLGIVVLFRAIDQAQWRVLTPLKSGVVNNLTLQITGLTAKLAPTAKKG